MRRQNKGVDTGSSVAESLVLLHSNAKKLSIGEKSEGYQGHKMGYKSSGSLARDRQEGSNHKIVHVTFSYGFSYSLKPEFGYSVPDLNNQSKQNNITERKSFLTQAHFRRVFFYRVPLPQLSHLEGNADRIKDF